LNQFSLEADHGEIPNTGKAPKASLTWEESGRFYIGVNNDVPDRNVRPFQDKQICVSFRNAPDDPEYFTPIHKCEIEPTKTFPASVSGEWKGCTNELSFNYGGSNLSNQTLEYKKGEQPSVPENVQQSGPARAKFCRVFCPADNFQFFEEYKASTEGYFEHTVYSSKWEHEGDDFTKCNPGDVNYKSNCPPEMQTKKKISEHTPSAAWEKFAESTEGVRTDLYLDPAGHCTVGKGLLVNKGPCVTPADLAKYNDKLVPIANPTGNEMYRVDSRFAKELKKEQKIVDKVRLAKPLVELAQKFQSGEISEVQYKEKLEAEKNRRVKNQINQISEEFKDAVVTQSEFDALLDRSYNGGLKEAYWKEELPSNFVGPPRQIKLKDAVISENKKLAAEVMRNSNNEWAAKHPGKLGGNGILNRRYQNYLMMLGDCNAYNKPQRP
jgi:GH24 family phage-related lysozyme (muramidase)